MTESEDVISEIETKCKIPLESADFGQYDRQPDGVLYGNEFSNEEIDCFVERLLLTEDYEVKGVFTENMATSLWEAIRGKLLIIKPESLSKEVDARRKDLLDNEFNDKIWSVSANVQISCDQELIERNEEGSISNSDRFVIKLVEKAGANLGIPHGLWKTYLSLEAGGDHFWIKEKHNSPTQNINNDYSHSGAMWSFNFTEKRRDDRFKINLYTFGKYFPDPSPDFMHSKYMAGGLVSLRNPNNIPLTFEASGNWVRDRYSAPVVTNLNTKSDDIISLNAEFGFLKNKWGGYALYTYNDQYKVSPKNIMDKESHSVSALTQYTADKGYVRFGLGGGVWESAYDYLPESLIDETLDAAQAHVRTKLKWDFLQTLTGQFEAFVYANYAEGDFNGWFPSWNFDGTLSYTPQKFKLNLQLQYNGNRKDLEHYQEYHTLTAGIKEFSYSPIEAFKVSASLLGIYSRQIGYNPNVEKGLQTQVDIMGRVVKKPWIWIGGRIAYYLSDYDESKYASDYSYLYGAVWLTIGY